MHQTTEKVYKFILSYKADHDGNSPPYRQIADACGLSSPSAAGYHIHKLADAGLVRLPAGHHGIEVVGGQWSKWNYGENPPEPAEGDEHSYLVAIAVQQDGYTTEVWYDGSERWSDELGIPLRGTAYAWAEWPAAPPREESEQ